MTAQRMLGVYYTAKLKFFQDFSVKVWSAYYIQIFTVDNVAANNALPSEAILVVTYCSFCIGLLLPSYLYSLLTSQFTVA